ncbi:hypothetical protein ACFRAR_30680 [Kitasatospora sp. NPDC056651]
MSVSVSRGRVAGRRRVGLGEDLAGWAWARQVGWDRIGPAQQ